MMLLSKFFALTGLTSAISVQSVAKTSLVSHDPNDELFMQVDGSDKAAHDARVL